MMGANVEFRDASMDDLPVLKETAAENAAPSVLPVSPTLAAKQDAEKQDAEQAYLEKLAEYRLPDAVRFRRGANLEAYLATQPETP